MLKNGTFDAFKLILNSVSLSFWEGSGKERIPAIAPKGCYMCEFKKSSVRGISILI
jgi:hypothetical protein